MKLDPRKQPFFSNKKPACSLREHWISFCLVDEFGAGSSYGGAAVYPLSFRTSGAALAFDGEQG